MIARLSEEEVELLDKAISNPDDFVVEVDNDIIYVIHTKTGEIEGDLTIHGQDLVIALLRHMGANAELV